MNAIVSFASFGGLPKGFMIAGFDIIVDVDHDDGALRAFKATQIILYRLLPWRRRLKPSIKTMKLINDFCRDRDKNYDVRQELEESK